MENNFNSFDYIFELSYFDIEYYTNPSYEGKIIINDSLTNIISNYIFNNNSNTINFNNLNSIKYKNKTF